MDKRIIELAIGTLEKRKTAIEEEIAGLRAALEKPRRHATVKMRKPAKPRKPGPRSAAAKKAASVRMKAYWAEKRAEKAKASQPIETAGAAAKPGPKSTAVKKAAKARRSKGAKA